MTVKTIKMATLALLLSGMFAAPVLAAGFDDGSFDENTNGDSASSENTTSTETPAGGFDNSGFGDGSFNDSDETTGPTQTDSGSTGNDAPDGGFDDGSFVDGPATPGGSGAGSDNTLPTKPIGGDDFPGGNVLPEPSGQGAIDGTQPQPVPAPGPTNNPASSSSVDPQITAFETRDFGVPPQNSLRQGQFHSATPVSVPGAFLVTTSGLIDAMNNNIQMIMIDVLGSNYTLPEAYTAQPMASAGSYNDRTQQQTATWLQQITNGNRDAAIVIFCSDPMCWLSYNATLRAVAAGYTNVYWYRGGITAWQMAGLPMRPSGF